MTEREHVTPEEDRQLAAEERVEDLDVPEAQLDDVAGGSFSWGGSNTEKK